MIEMEGRTELAIEARQHVEVEPRRHAGGVVIGRAEQPRRLRQVGTEQEGVARFQAATHPRQQRARLGGLVVADVRAEKDDQPALGRPLGEHQILGIARQDRPHAQPPFQSRLERPPR